MSYLAEAIMHQQNSLLMFRTEWSKASHLEANTRTLLTLFLWLTFRVFMSPRILQRSKVNLNGKKPWKPNIKVLWRIIVWFFQIFHQETHWLQMDVQSQVHIWWLKDSCEKKVLIMRRPFLIQQRWAPFYIGFGHGNTVWLGISSNGHKECLPQWWLRGRSVHDSTSMISGCRKGASYMQTDKGPVWLEEWT